MNLHESHFDPISTLDAVARAATVSPMSAAEITAWQIRTRRSLRKTLGCLDWPRVDPQPRVLDEVDRGDHVRRRIVLRTGKRSALPMYLLLPKSKSSMAPRPAVLALHGHGYGARDLVGIREDGTDRDTPEGYHNDFGIELVRRGFVVAAPEIACFGPRVHDYPNWPVRGQMATCHVASAYASMLGVSMAGLRVADNVRVLDYLATLPEVDSKRLGTAGISGGGMAAFFTTAVDRRLAATVVSGYFCDWRDGILDRFHCSCNYVPGLLKLGELSDLAALIAPRGLFIEHGTRDPLFPISAVRRATTKAIRAWKRLDASNQFGQHFFDGEHEINGSRAWAFLRRTLNSFD